MAKTREDNAVLQGLLQNTITQEQHTDNDTMVVSNMPAMTSLNSDRAQIKLGLVVLQT